MTAGEPTVSVVVPTYRRPDGLADLLAALGRQTLPKERFEVIVVDDCSGDGSLERVRRAAGGSPVPVQLLETAANGGPAVARNVGWRASRAELIAFIDDDCIPTPTWLAAGIERFADPAVGVVQGHTAAPPGVSVRGLDDWYLWRIVDGAGPYFEGCNIFYRRSALASAGGFDEGIGWWGEDTALGWRVVEAGWARGFAADAAAIHGVERRGWRWFVDNGLRESHLVTLAARHPGFRREAFWRPWAYRSREPLLVVGLVGTAIAVGARRLGPALAALPYLWIARPSIRRRTFLRLAGQIPMVDLARLSGHLAGSVRHRTLVI